MISKKLIYVRKGGKVHSDLIAKKNNIIKRKPIQRNVHKSDQNSKTFLNEFTEKNNFIENQMIISNHGQFKKSLYCHSSMFRSKSNFWILTK